MIPINLLPHRAERRKAQRRQFFIMAGVTAGIAVGIVALVHTVLEGNISNQEQRNKYLDQQIAQLDTQISEIKKLKEQTQQLLSRKKVVESLATNRTETVRLLDQLARLLPDGLYLRSVKQTGDSVNIQGYSTSNARVSTLMRSFESSPWLQSPTLIEIKAAKVGNTTLSDFNLNVRVVRASDAGTGTGAGSARPGAVGAAPGMPPATGDAATDLRNAVKQQVAPVSPGAAAVAGTGVPAAGADKAASPPVAPTQPAKPAKGKEG